MSSARMLTVTLSVAVFQFVASSTTVGVTEHCAGRLTDSVSVTGATGWLVRRME